MSNNLKAKVLKKGKHGIVRAIFSRVGLVLFLLVLQIYLVISLFSYVTSNFPHVIGGYIFLTSIMVLYIVNMKMDSLSKITWMVLIIILPLFGTLFFWYTKTEIGHRVLKSRVTKLVNDSRGVLQVEKIENLNDELRSLSNYLNRSGNFPIYKNSFVKYFSLGEYKFEEMLIQLEKAEKFIFLEYFIIEDGLMWGKILDILKRKASEGVEVRVLYDGTCAFSTLPYNYPKYLKKFNIKCKMFAPITPFVSTHYNYRDHRKILVIDGKVAFNGGINLADEYINFYERFGHWKDTAIMIEGEAVKSFTLMFLQMWYVDEKTENFDKYVNVSLEENINSSGYVIPYGDFPLDDDKVGERVYMDILNRSNKYVHIMTPYLILDSELENAIKFASERGVDVKIILPAIPDKKTPFALAKTHYKSLLESGVKIYEYTPGFVHAKVFVSDDIKGVVGTINLDYRSLYHHFECATYMYDCECIKDIEDDFMSTLNKCKKITINDVNNEKLSVKITGFIMKILAPLM